MCRKEHRFRRTDRDFVKTNRGARGLERRRHEVVIARRHAAGREEDVVAACERGAERLQKDGLRVAHDAEIRDLHPRAPERADQEGPVRVANLRGAGSRAGRDDLVPGHEHGGPDRARHPECGPSGGRGKDEVGGHEAAARGKQQGALRKDFSAKTDVRAGAWRDVEPHDVRADFHGVLDGDDGVAAGRHWSAGHHLPGGALGQRSGNAARARGAGARDESRRPPDFARANGPPVHGGRVERRERQICGDVLGEHPACAVGERYDDRGEWRDGTQSDREGVVESEHGRDRSKAAADVRE